MVEHLVCGSYEDRSKVRESWRAVAHPPSWSYVERTLRPVTVRIWDVAWGSTFRLWHGVRMLVQSRDVTVKLLTRNEIAIDPSTGIVYWGLSVRTSTGHSWMSVVFCRLTTMLFATRSLAAYSQPPTCKCMAITKTKNRFQRAVTPELGLSCESHNELRCVQLNHRTLSWFHHESDRVAKDFNQKALPGYTLKRAGSCGYISLETVSV